MPLRFSLFFVDHFLLFLLPLSLSLTPPHPFQTRPSLLTPSDPVEAYLADGACVAAWCRASLASTRALVEGAALAGSLSDVAAADGLATARTRLAALVPLSEALGRGDNSAAEAPVGDDDGDDGEMINGPASSSSISTSSSEAKKLAQCADVLDWCFTEGVAADSLRGKYASEAEWRGAVSRRRASVAGGGGGGSRSTAGVKITSTFLDALRARAGSSTASSPSSTSTIEYPPASTPRAAAPAIFLSGGSSASALSAKLDLFAYCLADAGEFFFFSSSVARSLGTFSAIQK